MGEKNPETKAAAKVGEHRSTLFSKFLFLSNQFKFHFLWNERE